MDRRGFLGAFLAFACSPAFPAPVLTYKGVPLVFDDQDDFIVVSDGFYEEMQKAWWRIGTQDGVEGGLSALVKEYGEGRNRMLQK